MNKPLQNMTQDELMDELSRIDCNLSPENLHADGERSRYDANRLYWRLMKEREAVEKVLAERQ